MLVRGESWCAGLGTGGAWAWLCWELFFAEQAQGGAGFCPPAAQPISLQRAPSMFPASRPPHEPGGPAWAQSSLSPLSVPHQHVFIPCSPHPKLSFYTQSLSLSSKLRAQQRCCPFLGQEAKAPRRDLPPRCDQRHAKRFPTATQQTDSPTEPHRACGAAPTPELILAHTGVPEGDAVAAVALATTFIPTTSPGELLNGMSVSRFSTVYPARFILREWPGFGLPQPGSQLEGIQFPATK